MPRKPKPLTYWLNKWNTTHGDKYDYSNVTSVANATAKVEIKCRKHRVFTQTATAHGNGQGCPKCAIEYRKTKQSTTKKEFIEKAVSIYGDKYNYSEILFIDLFTKIIITCKQHGDFSITPTYHLRNGKCPECTKNEQWIYENKETFTSEANKVHNNYYNYENSIFKKKHSLITIKCLKHGSFTTTPFKHVNGTRCPKCKITSSGRIRGGNNDDFVFKANMKHSNKYDYSKVTYIDAKTPIIITCPTHGDFKQRPNDHLTTDGCKKCGVEKRALEASLGTNDFIQRARKVHSDFYTYDKTVYGTKNTDRVIITCPKHDDFQQQPMLHLIGRGCPKCGYSASKPQKELEEYLYTITDKEIIVNDRKALKGKELDFYIPELKLAIEFNGIYWHSSSKKDKNYHQLKTMKCMKLGIRLIHVWSDDWAFKQSIVKTIIKNALNISGNETLQVSNLTARNIHPNTARSFLEKHHIEGYESSTHRVGLFNECEQLVAVGLFNKDPRNNNNFIMHRYANNGVITGTQNQIIKFFANENNFKELKHFVTLDYNTCDTFIQSGWNITRIIDPAYTYIINGEREKLDPKYSDLKDLDTIYDAGKIEVSISHDAALNSTPPREHEITRGLK